MMHLIGYYDMLVNGICYYQYYFIELCFNGIFEHFSYILRKLIRKCLLIGEKYFNLGEQKNWLRELSNCIVNILGPTYPSLFNRHHCVKLLLEYEEEIFKETYDKYFK